MAGAVFIAANYDAETITFETPFDIIPFCGDLNKRIKMESSFIDQAHKIIGVREATLVDANTFYIILELGVDENGRRAIVQEIAALISKVSGVKVLIVSDLMIHF